MTMVEWAVRRGYLQHLTDDQLWGNKEIGRRSLSNLGIKLEKELESLLNDSKLLSCIRSPSQVERAEKTF